VLKTGEHPEVFADDGETTLTDRFFPTGGALDGVRQQWHCPDS
jgi:hypothetical protein